MLMFACGFAYDNVYEAHATIMYLFDSIVSIVYFFTICAECLFLFRNQISRLCQMLSLWISAPLLIAPLLATTEFGMRLFFTSNIFLILFALMLVMQLTVNDSPKLEKSFLRATAIFGVLLLLYHGTVYFQIGSCKAERDAIIETSRASDVTEITMPAFPYSDYLHLPNPVSDLRLEYFKEFYGIPDYVEVIFE